MELDAEQRTALDERGYTVLRDVLSDAELARWRAAFEEVVGPAPEVDGRESGTRHAPELAGRSADLDLACSHPRVRAAVDHVLGRPARVLFFGARDPMPGFGRQALHTDWVRRSPREPFAVATALWLLDDFEPLNGATRVVPGTHRIPGGVPKSYARPSARHAEEELVLARAGSVLLFNGHLWHGGGENASRAGRRVLQVQFVAVELAPPDR